uniref:Uncharacterized protein n=1 Tax=viral metagenome TaxID=1070528 RepID=A0A6C0FB66_9ZZZZ|tara:strand:- start:14463 stop:14702 length:240 start_codon:yes stop_codon:yes gene_type:complete
MVSILFSYKVFPELSISEQDIIDFMETKGLALAAIERYEDASVSIKFWKSSDTPNPAKKRKELVKNPETRKKIKTTHQN